MADFYIAAFFPEFGKIDATSPCSTLQEAIEELVDMKTGGEGGTYEQTDFPTADSFTVYKIPEGIGILTGNASEGLFDFLNSVPTVFTGNFTEESLL